MELLRGVMKRQPEELEQALAQTQAELRRSRELFGALSQVAAELDLARPNREVLEALGVGLSSLGLECVVCCYLADQGVMVPEYLSVPPKLLWVAERLAGRTMGEFRVPVDLLQLQPIMQVRKAVYFPEVYSKTESFLPGIEARVARQILDAFSLGEHIPVAFFPLQSGERLYGLLGIWGEALQARDIEPLYIFARHVSVALENARLFEQLQSELAERQNAQASLRSSRQTLAQRAAELRLVLQSAQLLTSTLEMNQVLEIICEQLLAVADVDRVVLSRWNPNANQLRFWLAHERAYESPVDLPEQFDVQDFPSYIWAIQETRTLTLQLEDPELTATEQARFRSLSAATVIALPLARAGEVVGLVELASSRSRRFGDSEIRVCQAIAQHAVLALENASLFGRLQEELTERKLIEKQLQDKAFHDTLTGLPNRALLTEELGRVIARYQRDSKHQFAVLFMDLDRFKNVNDTRGHSYGDRLLVETGNRLRECVRRSDMIVRLGGDEFVVLMEDFQSLMDVTMMCERILEKVGQPLNLDDESVYLSTSIGVVVSHGEYTHPEEYLRDADIAMYRAKSGGRGRYELFDNAMREQVLRRLALERELRLAIENNQFVLHYMPIADLQRRQIIGFEALLRWQHPLRGLVAPMEFIPVAEETGLIIPIGAWVLAEACRQLHEWQIGRGWDPPLKMSVNISGEQLGQGDLVELVQDVLSESGIKPDQLCLEVTERALIEDVRAASATLARLKSLGVNIQLDDFGTGYSSLSYLRQFKVDGIKIDRSFLMQTLTNGNEMGLVRTIIMMGRELSMQVIAEGVETGAQANALQAMGCELGQGFLIAQPLPAKLVAELFQQSSNSTYWLCNPVRTPEPCTAES